MGAIGREGKIHEIQGIVSVSFSGWIGSQRVINLEVYGRSGNCVFSFVIYVMYVDCAPS
jgi:hypothetical protein